MADQPTIDADVVIESASTIGAGTTTRTVYRRLSTGERWAVVGACNTCGLCAIGAVPAERYQWTGPPGTPGACTDTLFDGRLDEPFAPGFEAALRAMAHETVTATVDGCALWTEAA